MSRKRNPNFTEAELQTLLAEVEKQKVILFSKLSNVSTNSAKKQAWEAICNKINAINASDHQRTVEEVRKKWTTYMSNTKKKVSEHRRESRKTGGGEASPPDDITPLQDKIVGIIGETPIEGIDGGTDTCSVEDIPCVSMESKDVTPNCSGKTERKDDCHGFSIDLAETQLDSQLNESSQAKRNVAADEYSVKLLEIETERLKIEQQRLQIERERLEIDKQRLLIEQQKHQLYMAQMSVNMTPFGIQIQTTQQDQDGTAT